jgi:hypothetical protein
MVILLLQLAGVAAEAQDRGTLTVTATVVTSVAVVMDQNGNPRVVVANPSAPNDNVSYVSYASNMTEHRKSADRVKRQPAAKRKSATLP